MAQGSSFTGPMILTMTGVSLPSQEAGAQLFRKILVKTTPIWRWQNFML